MDPDTTLQEIRELCRVAFQNGQGAELALLVTELDEWMSKGGFSPWASHYGKLKSFSGRFSFNDTEYNVVEIDFMPDAEYDTLTVYCVAD